MRYIEDFRYKVGDKVRFTGVGDMGMNPGAEGEVVALSREGEFPYRVRFEEHFPSFRYGYLMKDEELEPA